MLEVKRSNLTPLVFPPLEHGEAAMVVYCHLANFLSNKWNSSYSLTMGWL